MLYMPPVDMQRDMYTGPHGLDFKKYNELYPDWFKLMDEKEFFADPWSVAHGAVDRMFYRKLYLIDLFYYVLYQKAQRKHFGAQSCWTALHMYIL